MKTINLLSDMLKDHILSIQNKSSKDIKFDTRITEKYINETIKTVIDDFDIILKPVLFELWDFYFRDICEIHID